MMGVPQLILASRSPARADLLQGLGWAFDVLPSSVDEAAFAEGTPHKRSRLLATAKARDIAMRHPDACVIGCDTVVEAPDGSLLEKPVDADDARRMLRLMSDKTSIVHSGVCVIYDDKELSGLDSSAVTFTKLTPGDIEWWISTGNWEGRAGAFQIDGQAQMLISRLEGDWTGVVGLPMYLLGQLLREAGYPLMLRAGEDGRA